jgi:hypothetical protein
MDADDSLTAPLIEHEAAYATGCEPPPRLLMQTDDFCSVHDHFSWFNVVAATLLDRRSQRTYQCVISEVESGRIDPQRGA